MHPTAPCDHLRHDHRQMEEYLRPAFPDLLSKMDLQHEDVRELDHLVSELLPDPPEFPEARWADELRRPCIELHDRIQHHIVDEEDQLFRLADRDLTPDDQAMLARF
jgi:hypothetical protein